MSLAERATSPLMWSHYGDQHCGICLGYSVPVSTATNLYKVNYKGSRQVKASIVAAMLNGDDSARRQVDEAVLLRKAGSWSYEREWRLLGPRGPHHSLLELEEVIFGMRCETSIKVAVVKALKGRDRQIKFFEMCEIPDKFTLRKRSLAYDHEFLARCASRSLTLLEGFEPLDTGASSSD